MKNKWNLYAVNGMYYVAMATLMPFVSAYYSQNGMNESEIGILSAIVPLSSLLIQPLWAYISDKSGKRKGVLLLLCVGCMFSVLLFLKADHFGEFLRDMFLYAIFYSAILPLSDAMVIRIAEKKGADFSRIRMCGTISYAIAVIAAGYFLKSNFKRMFIINSFCFIILFFCCFTLEEIQKNSSDFFAAKSKKAHQKLFRSKQIIAVLICAFAMQVGIYFNSTFLSVFLLDIGYSQVVIGVMNCISALSEVPVLIVIKKIYKKYSLIPLLVCSVLLCAGRLLLVSSGSIVLIMCSQFLQGPSFMVCYFVCVTYINEQVHEDRISQGQSMLALVQSGLGPVCGTLVGGYIARRIGIQRGFFVSAVFITLIAAVAALTSKWIRQFEKVPE